MPYLDSVVWITTEAGNVTKLRLANPNQMRQRFRVTYLCDGRYRLMANNQNDDNGFARVLAVDTDSGVSGLIPGRPVRETKYLPDNLEHYWTLEETAPYLQNWTQPIWTSNSNTDGTISVSSYANNDWAPYKAFNGVTSGLNSWAANASSGWIELKLNYYIRITQIDFYNKYATDGKYSKNCNFTGMNGVQFGSSFVAVAANYGKTTIYVNSVITNIIRLNITSSTSNSIGAGQIAITAVRV